MKTSLWKQIIEWAKKNWKYVLLVLLVLSGVIWISIREAVIKHQAKKIAELEFSNNQISLERTDLKLKLENLQNEYDKIKNRNDSLKTVLAQKQKELKDLVNKHEQEIAELTNIPPDTVYLRLGLLYPNFDASPLKYPFSSSQIVPMYKIAVSYPLLSQEYVLQGKTLNNCLDLNTGYEKSIANLNGQIGNLDEQVKKCDQQVSNYKSEISLIQKDNRKQKFWKKVFIISTGVATGLIILK